MTMITESDKYNGAWNEINARLGQRMTVRLAFIATSWTILGIVIDKVLDKEFKPNEEYLVIFFLITLMQLLSLLFSAWSAYEDTLIGLLSAFCREFERDASDKTDKKTDVKPGWHTPSQLWLDEAARNRVYLDISFYGVIAINFIVSSFMLYHLNRSYEFIVMTIALQLIIVFFSFLLIYSAASKRKEIRKNYGFDKDLGFFIKKSES